MCTAGWPGKTCLSVCGTSLVSLSPLGPQLCPEAGRLGGGKNLQGGPQAVSVHYCYRDGTWPAGGQTFSPYLLRSSAVPLCVCLCGWVDVHLCLRVELKLTPYSYMPLPTGRSDISIHPLSVSQVEVHIHVYPDSYNVWQRLRTRNLIKGLKCIFW